MSATLELTKALMARPSVTPEDGGCLTLIADRLAALGFQNEWLPFAEVNNLWSRIGTEAPLFVFAGHLDVVPPGPLNRWDSDPFIPTEREGVLYGRGAADMKSGVAAMVVAAERFLAAQPTYRGSLAFLLTSDEEGPARNGTVKVVDTLTARQEHIDWCLVGEPSSQTQLGDTMKNGRRGSLTGTIQIHGIQGHVAYPHLADNPVHRFAPVLQALCAREWDQGNEFFPPTTFQIANIHAGTGANNVIPGSLEVMFNFRYSTAVTAAELKQQVIDLFEQQGLKYDIEWDHSGQPFLTASGELVDAAQAAVESVCGYRATLSTAGGTSDGRFIAPTGAQVIELGLINASIHKVNECANIADLEPLTTIYQRILERLLTG